MDFLSEEYWNDRYKTNAIGWDIGATSRPLKEYIDQLTDKTIRILIPGAGNSYEAEYLLEQGFQNVYVLDFAPEAMESFLERCPHFPKKNTIIDDFFTHKGDYDLILEQTFFCALNPSLRSKYVEKMAELLSEKGKLAGVFFNREFEGGPPFGGNIAEYTPLFSSAFESVKIEECYNSIKPRMGSEVFVMLEKGKG